MNVNTWNIVLVAAAADVPAAKIWISLNFPAGTSVYYEQTPPVAPNAANVNVVVWQFAGTTGVLRTAVAGSNGPFFVLHVISP
jgi:hypothetical protein